MAEKVDIEYLTTIELVIKVHANSSELSEEELRKCVKGQIEKDLVRDCSYINGYAGCTTEFNKSYSYNYEAVLPVKDK